MATTSNRDFPVHDVLAKMKVIHLKEIAKAAGISQGGTWSMYWLRALIIISVVPGVSLWGPSRGMLGLSGPFHVLPPYHPPGVLLQVGKRNWCTV